MPPSDPEGYLLWVVGKYTRHFAEGEVTARELADKLYGELAADKVGRTHLAPEMIRVVHERAREEFTRLVRDALRSEYRHPACHGTGPKSAEEVAQEQAVLTERVRMWAKALSANL